MRIEIGEFERPTPAAVAHFAGVAASVAANLSNQCMGLRHTIRRICGVGVVVGPALTAQAPCGDNLAIHVALTEARAGDILVLATGACEDCAVVGDRVAAMAANGGIAAIVTDGLVRDIVGLREIGLPVYARGLSPNGPKRTGPASVGLPVEFGRIVIQPGDLVVADEDGVAVIPFSELARATARLKDAALEEVQVAEDIRMGARRPAWIDPLLGAAHRLPARKQTDGT